MSFSKNFKSVVHHPLTEFFFNEKCSDCPADVETMNLR